MSGSAAPPLLTVSNNGIGVVPDVLLNTYVQGSAVVANLRAFVGLQNMTVYLIGTTTAGDGGQGSFYWDPTSIVADDNGTTCVQPNGVLYGRWLRLSGGTTDLPALPNIAALRALASAVPLVWVEGYYTPGDGGEGMFNIGAAGTDNGGTIILSGNGTYYRETQGLPVSCKAFGAKGDGTTDDTTALQKWITAAGVQGFECRIPVGKFVTSATLTGTFGITMRGVNPGIGPGVVSNTDCSIILCAPGFLSGDVLSFTTYNSCIFSDFQVAGALGLGYTSACPRSSGAGIRISAPNPGTSVNTGTVIDHCCFSGIYQPIYLSLCDETNKTRNNYFQAWGSCPAFAADAGGSSVESNCGDVIGNLFFGNPGSSQVAGAEVHCGYGLFSANKYLGAQYGIIVFADLPVNIGRITISENSFEEMSVQSILVTQSGTTIIGSVQIINNQFSNVAQTGIQSHIFVAPQLGGSSANLLDINISNNNFYSDMSGGAATYISVTASNVVIANNIGVMAGGGAYGVTINASAGGPINILDNMWTGTLTANGGYLIQSPALLRDTRTGIFNASNLSAFSNATNGSEIYVDDGQATSSMNLTVTGSGSGCTAWKMRGAWLTLPITG